MIKPRSHGILVVLVVDKVLELVVVYGLPVVYVLASLICASGNENPSVVNSLFFMGKDLPQIVLSDTKIDCLFPFFLGAKNTPKYREISSIDR